MHENFYNLLKGELIMKKKILTSIMLLMLSVLMVACNQGGKVVDLVEESPKNMDIQFDENGVAFDVPEKWLTSNGIKIGVDFEELAENVPGQIILSYISQETLDVADKISQEINNIPDDDIEAREKALEKLSELENETKDLCRIVTIGEGMGESNVKKELFNKYDSSYLIGEKDSLEFYLLYNNEPETEGLSEESKKDYEEYYEEIESFKSLINIRVYGSTTMIVFLGVYLGIVFLVSSAAVLALQQLSDISDSLDRYKSLKKIGVTNKMINKAILQQNLVYFMIPLALAIIHSIVGMIVINKIFSAYNSSLIGSSSLMISLALLIIYGGYFYATYVGSKNIIRNSH